MNNKVPLLEIEPKELKFIFELKKQSSCSIQLTNNTHHYVAFKVKTTSPKKYSVRPNVGVLLPKSSCEFIVTMQAQRVPPADRECKDKFLIQSTTVSAQTTSEDVTSSLFVRDGSRYVEENKLKVALISPPDSPELSPVNGNFKNGRDHEKVLKNPEYSMVHEVLKHEADTELKPKRHMGMNTTKDVEEPREEEWLKVTKDGKLKPVKDVEELKPDKAAGVKVSKGLDLSTVKNVEGLKPEEATELEVSKYLDLNRVKNVEELKPEKVVVLKVAKDPEFIAAKNAEELKPEQVAELRVSKDLELKTAKNVEQLKTEKEAEVKVSRGIEELKLMEAIQEMKLKLDGLESKLNESGMTISKLTEERRISNQETKILQEKLADIVEKGPRKVQVGFPLLYVCMVALVCVFLGYHLHS